MPYTYRRSANASPTRLPYRGGYRSSRRRITTRSRSRAFRPSRQGRYRSRAVSSRPRRGVTRRRY